MRLQDLQLPLHLVADSSGKVTPQKRERFLKGPVPWSWLERAMKLPGRALHVGIWVWFYAGMVKDGHVPLNLSRLGFDRSAASRGLAALEKAGLLVVTRRPGNKVSIWICR